MTSPLNRRTLAISVLPNFLQTVLTLLLVLAPTSTVFSYKLAKSPLQRVQYSLINEIHFTFNSNSNVNSNSITNHYNSALIFILTMEIDTPFNNPSERSPRTSPSSSVKSTRSNLLPLNLNQSTPPPTVTIESTMESVDTINLGGLTISTISETTEQARSATGALYSKAIRATYDDDKKGKLDLLKLVQSKQQQPYVATSISVNDPEKLLNHYSLSKLNKECSRNLAKYDLLGPFKTIVFPTVPGEKKLDKDSAGKYLTHNLFNNTFQVTAQQVANSSRWYSGYTLPADRFQEDLEWSLAYFENNVDSSLYARIHSKLLTFDERCRGGPLFFKLLNDETTTNSDANKKALIVIVDTYKIKTDCKGEIIPDVIDLFRSITDTVHALHDDSLPDEYVDKLISIFTSTSVDDFNSLFESLQKDLFKSQLQASITNSLIVPSTETSSLTNNLAGASYVLEYAGKAYYTLCQNVSWDKCLQQAPGDSAFINPADGSQPPPAERKCFNCNDPNHHLRNCPKPRDHATINKNRELHSGAKRQPTGFRGRTPYTRPTKWRLPEDSENNKRVIDNKPYTFNPTSKRWEPDSTPDSGQLPQGANVIPPPVPPTTPSQPTLPPPPSPAEKGAFFTGGYNLPPNMSTETKKQFITLSMKHLQQQWDDA